MKFIALYIVIELVSNFLVFPILNWRYGAKKESGEKMPPWLKGVIERICLISGLLLNVPHILVAFGALKIGTKLDRNESDTKKDTEYYLVGNLISIMIAFVFIFLMQNETVIKILDSVFSSL